MRKLDLKDMGTAELRESEQLMLDMIRTRYPHLDLRIGTALRDLLVVPDSAIHAWFSAQASEQRAVTSLKTLVERADAGEDIDTEDLDRILSNFNMEGVSGTAARGIVRVVVSEPRMYSIVEGASFATLDGVPFSSTGMVVADTQPVGAQVQLFKGASNWYFFVPVVCSVVGSSGNIQNGTALSLDGSFASFVSASAYGDFSGGSEVENLGAVRSRIPVALSNRGLLTQSSVEAAIRDRFDSSDHKIVAVSTVGYGNPAQLRDKHNVLGIGVGGRVDIYVRNFTAPYMATVTKTFDYDPETGKYTCTVGPDDAPGMQSVQSVFDSGGDGASSYPFSVSFGAEPVSGTWHDFDVGNGAVEMAGTLWRNCTVSVKDTGSTSASREFGVSIVCLHSIADIQEYVDRDDVRNVGSDFVVRCPAICRVSVNVRCRYRYGTLFDTGSARAAVANYINSTGFVGRITRSEVACVLRGVGASSVDLDDDYMLTGYVIDASGRTHRLYGDALDVDDVQDPAAMLTRDTCVFAAAPENINITAVPE